MDWLIGYIYRVFQPKYQCNGTIPPDKLRIMCSCWLMQRLSQEIAAVRNMNQNTPSCTLPSLSNLYQNIDKLRYLLTERLGSSSVCPVDHLFSNGATDLWRLYHCMALYPWSQSPTTRCQTPTAEKVNYFSYQTVMNSNHLTQRCTI